jgi:transposase
MSTSLTVTTERLDDLVLLHHVMMRLHLPAIVDRHLPRHWLHQGLDWGWVATIWLDHILSQGDHRKLTVRDWVCQARYTLQRTTGLLIRATSFADDRLTIVLRELSQPTYWHAIEQDLAQQTIRVYHLTPRRVRVDATTVSDFHAGSPDSLFQFGHSKTTRPCAESRSCAPVTTILRAHRVEGLLAVDYERQVTEQWKQPGRGRPSAVRPSQRVETVRYQITVVVWVDAPITAAASGYG